MSRSVIVTGSRTAIGKLSGGFATLSAQDLGGAAIKGVLDSSRVDPALVDAVLMGQVIQAGQGQITARQAAVKGGVPMSVHATTINKVCLSGLQTIYLADLMIRAGEADIIIAGGMESMTNAPYLLPGARAGYRIGDQNVVDSMMFDGLTCAFDQCAMGLATERYNHGRISRARQDRVLRAQPPTRRCGDQFGKVRRGDRWCPGTPAQGRPRHHRYRRGCSWRHDRCVTRRASRGVRKRRHHHRWKRLADFRRWRRGAGDVRRASARPGSHAPG